MDFLAGIFLLIAAVHATPVIKFPFNAQLPLVARVSTPFEFIFSESTFSAVEPDAVTYSISNSPSWLQLETSNRTLSGTPQIEDVGTITFEITCSDATGSASMPATIIVSADLGTVLAEPVPPLLAEDGQLSGITTFSVHPSKPFSFAVDPNTFNFPKKNTLFYARSADNSPLPSWVRFSSSTLTFSGRAPAITPSSSTPQIFNLSLLASNIDGFRSATSTFHIAVSPHILAFKKPYLKLKFSAGEHFRTPRLRHSLSIDGRHLRDDDIARVATDLPGWLTLDEDFLSLSGTPPESADTDTAVISVTDVHGDVANITIRLQGTELFSENICSHRITAGEDFSYTFDDSLLTNKSTTLEVDPNDQFPWIEYEPAAKTIHGHAPSDIETQNITISLFAKNGRIEEAKPFTLRVYHEHEPCTSNTTSTCPTSTSAPEPIPVADSTNIIVPVTVIVPIFILAIAAFLRYLPHRYWPVFCRRGRDKGTKRGPTPFEIIEKPPRDSDPGLVEEPDEGSQETNARSKPKNHTSKGPISKLRNSLTRRRDVNSDEESQNFISFSQMFSFPISSSDILAPLEKSRRRARFADKTHPSKSKSMTFTRKRGSFNPYWPRERPPEKPTDSRRSHKPHAICPHGRKISGARHAPSASSPPMYEAVSESWLTAQSTSTSEASVGTLTSRFPLPPGSQASASTPTKATERPYRHSTDSALLPSPRRFSDSVPALMHGEPGNVPAVSPLFSGRPTPSGSFVNRRSNSWTTTYNTLSTTPGSKIFLRDYPNLPSRAPSFGSVFNIGLGLRRPSGDHPLQHSRTRSHQSGGSGSGSRHGWMVANTSNRLEKVADTEREESSNGHRRWYGVPSPLPPQRQQPKSLKFSYPLVTSSGSNEAFSSRNPGDGAKPSNKNDSTTSPSTQNTRPRRPSQSYPADKKSRETSPQTSGREQQRWKLGETQESRYASIRGGSLGPQGGVRIVTSNEDKTFI